MAPTVLRPTYTLDDCGRPDPNNAGGRIVRFTDTGLTPIEVRISNGTTLSLNSGDSRGSVGTPEPHLAGRFLRPRQLVEFDAFDFSACATINDTYRVTVQPECDGDPGINVTNTGTGSIYVAVPPTAGTVLPGQTWDHVADAPW